MLVLAGIVVGALAGAGISLVKVLADPYNQLPAITFWLLGSLSGIKVSDVQIVVPLVIVGLVPLVALRWRIGVMSLGDDEAKALGVNVRLVRGVVIAGGDADHRDGGVGVGRDRLDRAGRCRTWRACWSGRATTACCRSSLLLGAAFLVLIDTVARTAARIEIPLGLLTAILGAPVFVWLLARGRRMWS